MKYYLIEEQSYNQAVVTEEELNAIKEASEQYEGFNGIVVIKEITEKEYNNYIDDDEKEEIDELDLE